MIFDVALQVCRHREVTHLHFAFEIGCRDVEIAPVDHHSHIWILLQGDGQIRKYVGQRDQRPARARWLMLVIPALIDRYAFLERNTLTVPQSAADVAVEGSNVGRADRRPLRIIARDLAQRVERRADEARVERAGGRFLVGEQFFLKCAIFDAKIGL